jgi:hypothetical protein
MKKLWQVSAGIALVPVITFILHAQEAATQIQGRAVSEDFSSMSDLELELKTVESVPPIPASDVPEMGAAFYSAQHAPGTPEPWPPMPDSMGLAAWPLGDGVFLLDDLGKNYDVSAKAGLTTGGVRAMDDFSDSSSSPANTNFFIGVEGTNIVVSWISSTNKIYLLEHRATLTGETQWSELQNYLLATANTNVTRFVHTNILQSQPMDFYRLFDVTPVARDDFFAVDQDSSANQLDIFQNDSDPNDDLFFISSLASASHGSISYSSDASTFQYTPDSGFYGVDNFAYTITSNHGDTSSNATVTVFVNQSGNSPPSVNDTIITLQTNVYTATFNALTNSSDPDGDSPVLFSVNPPGLGSVSNDTSGNITYTRNPNVFGNDAFTYIVTDGKGGYAVGNVKILQLDTDGDGMPDQWEMANGLDPTTDDSMDDPDGDGLPNLAEFVLGTNPNAPDNPLNFSSVTNGMQVSDFVQLPIYGLSATVQNPPITLYVNGAPAENSFLAQGPDGQWLVNWDTTFLTNGSYQIQLECSVAPPASPDSITDVLGVEKTVEVGNPIVFDKLTSQFTSFLLIDGTLADTNDTYDVQLYDDSGNPLVYATGLIAPDGQISLYWDLTDGNGNQISFGNIQAVFTLHPPESPDGIHANDSSSSTSFSRWFLKDAANYGGPFTVAWGWNSYGSQFNNYETETMSDGVINILGNPSDFSSYDLLPVANIPYGDSAFRFDSDSDKNIMMHALQNSGNFFWLGHAGSAVILGDEMHSAIGTADVLTWLGNAAYQSTRKHPKTDKHPYNLLILDGCQTYDSRWANVFGIDFSAGGSPYSTADYDAVGRPERAFVGWTQIVLLPSSGDFSGLTHAQYAEALGNLFGYWMAGYPLNYCMSQFSGDAIPNGFTGADSWEISGCVDLER